MVKNEIFKIIGSRQYQPEVGTTVFLFVKKAQRSEVERHLVHLVRLAHLVQHLVHIVHPHDHPVNFVHPHDHPVHFVHPHDHPVPHVLFKDSLEEIKLEANNISEIAPGTFFGLNHLR